MLSFSYNHVCIESYALNLPEKVLKSEEIENNFSDLYQKLGVPFGTLERLSGIKERRVFADDETPSAVATKAGQMAIDKIGFDRSNLQALFNCSVTRDYFEPATAVIVHDALGFSEDSIAMDITNACIGFSHGMVMLANMIENGTVKAGLVVTGENISRITNATYNLIRNKKDLERAEFIQLMATFTLGSGAAAVVLAHDSIATSGHRLMACASRAASVHNKLCMGNGDFCFNQLVGLNPIMHTESRPLMANAAKLGGRTWADLSETLKWNADDVDNIFCHQVGKVVNRAFYETMGLPIEKEYTVYPRLGNMISVAMPAALFSAAEEGYIKAGTKNVLTAFGSGLNALFTGIIW